MSSERDDVQPFVVCGPCTYGYHSHCKGMVRTGGYLRMTEWVPCRCLLCRRGSYLGASEQTTTAAQAQEARGDE